MCISEEQGTSLLHYTPPKHFITKHSHTSCSFIKTYNALHTQLNILMNRGGLVNTKSRCHLFLGRSINVPRSSRLTLLKLYVPQHSSSVIEHTIEPWKRCHRTSNVSKLLKSNFLFQKCKQQVIIQFRILSLLNSETTIQNTASHPCSQVNCYVHFFSWKV